MPLPGLLAVLVALLLPAVAQITTTPRAQPSPLNAPLTRECCQFASAVAADASSPSSSSSPSASASAQLMRCVNGSAVANMANVFRNLYRGGGPSLGFGLVTYATPDIWDYTAYSLAIMSVFTEHNGYVMRHLDPATSDYDKKDARWNKVKILEEALHPDRGWARDLQYLMWVDADLVVLDMGLRLEQVVAEHPRAHILLSAEHAGSSTLMNSGAVIVRNSAWARMFLREWWTHGDRNLYSDQEQFDLLYRVREAEWGLGEKVAVLPPDALNSDPPAMTQQKPHNQVLHLMGEHTPYRVKVFGEGFRELCRGLVAPTLGGAATPPAAPVVVLPQLNLTRSNLHAWTLTEYSKEAAGFLRGYRDGAAAGEHSLKTSRKLSNSIHHHAVALEYRNGPGDREEAARLRIESYQLLLRNLENRRSLNEAHKAAHAGQVLQDWPELLKIVTEAGQNIVQLGSLDERKRLAAEVMGIMREMLASCHPDQRPAVMHMFAAFQTELGMIALQGEDLHGALAAFQLGLTYSRELALASGDHILIQPLTMVANILCELKRFTEAFGMYAEAIRLAERTLGPQHESLAQHLLNGGIAFVQSGHPALAQPMLKRALRLCESNGLPTDDVVFVRARQFLEYAEKGQGMVISEPAPLEPPSRSSAAKKRTKRKKQQAAAKMEL